MIKKMGFVFLNLIVLGLIVGALFVFNELHQRQLTEEIVGQETDKYAYLTTRGLRNLSPLPETDRIIPTNRTKKFFLEAKETSWEVLPGIVTKAITYNGKTPGPVIRVMEGDVVEVTLKNQLKQSTSIHFHGLHLPNQEDGVPPLTQQEIAPGETFTYKFMAGHAGTYMYHPHINSVQQIDKGLYGAFIIDPQNSNQYPKFDKEYTFVMGGWNIPSSTFDRKDLVKLVKQGFHGKSSMDNMGKMDKEETMQSMEDINGMGQMKMEAENGDQSSEGGMAMDYNFWTMNGKAYPLTEKILVSQGDRVRVRLINISNLAHPMHLHGTDFRVIAEDSHPLAQPPILNTLNVAPGKTFDLEFIADNPGEWVFHCHELHHTENDGIEPGGLMTTMEYDQKHTKATNQH